MKKAIRITVGACAALMLMGAAAAQADDSLYAARIGAVDAPALAHFYEFAFGMEQVLTRGSEIMLNFGDTVDEAKANKAPVLIVIRRNTDDVQDPVSHLIFYISDFPVTAAAIEAAGGKMLGKPHFIKKTGDTIGNAVDPAGNRFELIEPPKTESPQT
ncbi:MAG TPA: VOC family protein [Gammaproteobacteria bacterium]|nr:VOC family protein [Gammaproteobacteria bacterium]